MRRGEANGTHRARRPGGASALSAPDRRGGLRRGRCAANPDRVALRTRGGEREITWSEYGELVDRFALGLRGARARARRHDRADADQPARVPHRRLRRDEPRRDALLALPDARARPDRLSAHGLGRAHRRHRAGVPRQRARGAGVASRRSSSVVVVDGETRRTGRARFDELLATEGDPQEIERRARGRRAGRPAHADLHVGHDRARRRACRSRTATS